MGTVNISIADTIYSYNFYSNANIGQGIKTNELATLFKEKTDCGAQDIDL